MKINREYLSATSVTILITSLLLVKPQWRCSGEAANDANAPKEIVIYAQKVPSITSNFAAEVPNVEKIHVAGSGVENVAALRLPTLKSLSLENNHIRELPSFEGLPNLESLKLNGNKLRGVGTTLRPLKKLLLLHLFGNDLSSFPDLQTLENLEELHLGDNPLTTVECVPPTLKKLYLYNTKIEALPRLRLASLEFLNLGDNNLKTIRPGTFGLLASLKTLFLYNCKLTQLPADVSSLTTLEALNLGDNPLRSINEGALSRLVNLRELYLYNTLLAVFPRDLKSLRLGLLNLGDNPLGTVEPINSVKKLLIYNNQLKEFPLLPSVEELAVERNQIAEIGQRVLSRMSVKKLIVSENRLKVLPEDFFAKSLVVVKLSDNGLTKLPEISDLADLTEVEINSNKLRFLTVKQFNNLERLETLRLVGNLLSHINKDSFTNLPSLKTLDLKQNKLININCRAFAGLTSLQRLDLSDNKLTVVPEKCFVIRNLENLALENNDIAVFDVAYFMFLHQRSLKFINLSGNKWNCRELEESLQTLSQQWIDFLKRHHREVGENVYGINCRSLPINKAMDSFEEKRIYSVYH